MQDVVSEKPYVFVAPYPGVRWPRVLQRVARRWVSRSFGVEQVRCEGLEKLVASRRAGDGVLIAANHCRPADPFVILEVTRRAGVVPYTMASAHLFAKSKVQSWLLRRAGVFSVYREGLDRQAIGAASDILAHGDRPLVIFPEGVVTRTNDRLNALMEGTAFIARTAAKKRAEATPPGRVVVHPVALRYSFGGDIKAALEPTLAELEQRLSWRVRRGVPLVERITKVGVGLLSLKEIEVLGAPHDGTIPERVERLINHLLRPLEEEWLKGKSEGTVVGRVKKLRSAVVPGLVGGELDGAERERRWRQLADMYLAQQLSAYPPDYLKSNPTAERMLETVERFEEDLTDECRVYRPMSVTATVGEAIVVNPVRERGAAEDPVMAKLEDGLEGQLGIAAAG